jgi:phage shock protein C
MSAKSNRFTLNREKKRFLGVCAGLADYLEVPTVVIRIITLLACLTWPTLILVYFVAYWWLKQGNEEGKVHNFITDSKAAAHFRNVDYRKAIYRNPNNSRIAGVCSGIADYLEIGTFSVRLITLLSFFIFGPFTFFAYCVCWIVLERNPDTPRRGSRKQRRKARRDRQAHAGSNADESDMSDMADDMDEMTPHVQSSKEAEASIAMSMHECSEVFNKVETRLRDVEAFITSKKFRLHCEINRI